MIRDREGVTAQVIHLHRDAPPKPPLGAPCNGCGACCALEPCPLGVILSRRRRGACVALRWDERQTRYVCGALAEPATVLPRWLRGLAPAFARLVPRWIAAGRGCDAALETTHITNDGNQPGV